MVKPYITLADHASRITKKSPAQHRGLNINSCFLSLLNYLLRPYIIPGPYRDEV